MRRSFSVLAFVTPTLVAAGCGFDPAGNSPVDAAVDGSIDAASDLDSDGVADGTDNCPSVANAQQFDEDGDLRGDVCDNCPHVTNSAQANSDGDGVGDACDPDPNGPDHIELFEGFNGSSVPAGWGPVGLWAVSGGQLRQPSIEVGDRVIGIATEMWPDAVVETSASIVSISPDTPPRSAVRSVSILSRFQPDTIYGNGYLCSAFESVLDASPASQISTRFLNNGTVTGGDTDALPIRMNPGDTIRLVAASSGMDQSCETFATASVISSHQDNVLATGGVAVRTFGVAANFRYVVVIAPGP